MIKIFPIRILAVVIIAFIEKPHVNSQKFPGDGQLGGTHSPSLMSLISPRDIAELTQVATQFAAQTLRSNGDVISKSGPEVQPVNFNAHPSEIFGQSLTNIMHPARQNLAGTLIGQPQIATERNAAVADENRTPSNNGGSLIEQLAGSFLGGTMMEAESTAPDSSNREGLMGMDKMVGQAMRLFSAGRQSSGSTSSANFDQGVRARSSQPSIPTLQQI